MAEGSVSREQLVFEAVTRQASAEIQQLRRDYRGATAGMSDDALKLVASQARLEAALSRHGPASSQARNAEIAFRQALQQTTAAAQREAGVLNEAAAAKGRFGQAGVVAGRGATSLKTAAVGSTAAFLGATGLVFALQAGARAAIEFDRSMRNVNSIAHLSEGDLRSLGGEVLKLANSTGKGPTDLANGLYDIVSSGFQAADAIKILEVSAKAASAGMTDTATSSKGVVAVLNAYHLSADQARATSDLLFQEVNLGVNTFQELAQNLGDTAPQAAALKIPFQEIAAALAAITKSGTPMSEASTQVSRVLTAMIKPSKELQAEFKRMGYSSGQAAVEALGFSGVLERLSRDAAGNQQTIAAWLGEVRGIRGVLNLTGSNLATYNDLLAQMGAATEGAGATQKAFEEQQKSLGFQIDRVSANFKALASGQGGVNSALAGTAKEVGDLTAAMGQLSTVIGSAGRVDLGPFGHLGDVLQEVNKWTNPLAMQLELIKKGLDEVSGSADNAAVSLGDLAAANRVVAPGEGHLGGTNLGTPKPKTGSGSGGNPDLDYRIALESATSDRDRLSLLTQHRRYLDSRIAGLKAKDDLAGWQKQQLLDLIQKRNQTQNDIDAIVRKSDQDTAAKQAARERAQLATEKKFEQSSPALRNIHRAQARAASTKGKQDDVDQAQREVEFWKNRLEQLDRTSGAYDHVAERLSAAEDKLARSQGKLSAAQTTAAASPELQAPRNLRIRQLQAALTDGEGDDLLAARAIERYWQRRLDHTKKASKVYEDILQQLVSAHDAVKGLEQQLDGSGPSSAGAIQASFLESMQTLLAKVAPNFGTYGGGMSSTQAYEMTEAARETAAHLRGIAGRRGRDEAYDQTTAAF